MESPKHIVVLMFENRSFDHLFGAFPRVNGLFDAEGRFKPDCYNLAKPTLPPSPANPTILPQMITPDVPLHHDFDHNFGNGMMQELFGPDTTGWQAGGPINAPPQTYPSVNSGFYSTVASNVQPTTPINGCQAISYFEPGSLKVLHRMAAEFVLCDNWFCDIPGDTLLNRFFMHGAQTGGLITDNQNGVTLDAPTIFDRIEECGRDWKIYTPYAKDAGEGQNDCRFLNPHIQNSPHAQHSILDFASDASEGTLPFYSFLMCWLPLSVTTVSTDTSMHPASDIRPGENYLAAVYAALRGSKLWNDTLLIVTFDENGGIYDHVPPPATVAPNNEIGSDCDSFLKAECVFDFTLLGPRIPALLISPWLAPRIASGQFQNTSILRLLEDLMGAGPLTARDANAPRLESVFSEFGLSQPRTDCPASFTAYPGFPYADGDLSKPYVSTESRTTPPAYMASLAKTYRLSPA